MVIEEEEEENMKFRAKGKDEDGYYFFEDIHHLCPPNKDRSQYPDTSPNCFFVVCMLPLFSLFIKCFKW